MQQHEVLQGAVPWTGGEDSTHHPAGSDPNTARRLLNIHITDTGSKRIRGGLRSYFRKSNGVASNLIGYTTVQMVNATPVLFMDAYAYGANKLLWNIFNGKMYVYDKRLPTFEIANSSVLANTRTHASFGTYVLFGTKVGGGKLYYWTGTRSVLPANAPKISLVQTHFNRIIGAGSIDSPDLWYASFVGDPNDWSVSDTADPDQGGFVAEIPGNQRITAISPSQYNGFYIGTEEALHFIAGQAPSNYSYNLISGSVGNLGHRTLKNVRNDVLGWNDHGCHNFRDTDRYGGLESNLFSSPVRESFKRYAVRDPEQYFSVVAPNLEAYITFIPHKHNANQTLAFCYYYNKNQWAVWHFNTKVRSAVVWDHGHDPTLLLGTSYSLVGYLTDGHMKDYENESFEQDFPVEIETQRVPLAPSSRQVANISHLRIWARATRTASIPVTIRIGGKTHEHEMIHSKTWRLNEARHPEFPLQLGTDALVDIHELDVSEIFGGGNGRYARFVVSDDDAANLGSIEIIGYEFVGSPSGETHA